MSIIAITNHVVRRFLLGMGAIMWQHLGIAANIDPVLEGGGNAVISPTAGSVRGVTVETYELPKGHIPSDSAVDASPLIIFLMDAGANGKRDAAAFSRYYARKGATVVMPHYHDAERPLSLARDENSLVAVVNELIDLNTTDDVEGRRVFLAGGGIGASDAVRIVVKMKATQSNGALDRVSGVIAISGIYDFHMYTLMLDKAMVNDKSGGQISTWLGGGPAEVQKASPVNYVTAADYARPPILITFAEHERFGIDEEARELYALLVRAKWPVRMLQVPGSEAPDQFKLLGQYHGKKGPCRGGTDGSLYAGVCAALPAIPDTLGTEISRFLADVDTGIFTKAFKAAWPEGIPTAGVNADYTGSSDIPTPEGAIEFKNLQYKTEGGLDPNYHSLDLFLPKPITAGETKFPLIFYVHGGGWVGGDKRMLDNIRQLGLMAGYAVASVNYRLAPKAKFPAHIEDVADSFGWIYKNADRYGIDKNRIVVGGNSAGAHLITEFGVKQRYLTERGIPANAVKGVVAIAGIYDVRQLDLFTLMLGPKPTYIRDLAFRNSKDWDIYSPLAAVRAGSPPFLITYSAGSGERPRIPEQSIQLYTKMVDLGVDVQLLAVPDRSHFNVQLGMGRQIDSRDDVLWPAMCAFFYRVGVSAD